MVIKMALMQFDTSLISLMLPVVALTAVFNAILVGAVSAIKHALKLAD